METSNLPLNSGETELLLQAPALVTMLVAGSDGDYKENEIARGIDITRWKKIHARPDLLQYYDQVRPRYQSDIDQLRKQLPRDINERYRYLSDQLKQLNPILFKLHKPLAEQIYASLRELAQQVAEASGGVFGYLSIGYNESKVITLPMIDDPRTYRV
ncbi:hypothetical protein [Cesiribacter andamanensis]|uniref:Uncharacterized protein n=1 Tax=Cesiribacter andamanensis AMV16 TaxID=1279009 RepID=M7NH41_9BACT|nr:hypothetical protein [Cesiribacter andamanensis]EMR01140.1 hypothetical protein ADICEAN_03724 [Cesiribacter andamanensis AMV16]